MRIGLVGPGIMSIPPNGWGAVEILIWDYYKVLKSFGYDVFIINNPNKLEIIKLVNTNNLDFVHIHYDVFYDIIPYLNVPLIAITSHYPYIDQIDKHQYDNYGHIFKYLCKNHHFLLFCLADKDKQMFIRNGADPSRIYLMTNGADDKSFKFRKTPKKKSIYLGKITARKNQALYVNEEDIDFVGNIADNNFKRGKNYLGEWDKTTLYEHLTDYGNLVLLSDGESDPLVVKEALMAGLGLVLTRTSANCIDDKQPFIDIIDNPHDIKNNMKIIRENYNKSILIRDKIREYALSNFTWEKIVKKYINVIKTHKIVLVGPGGTQIPPKGWGAVEIVIWDYYETLKSMGYTVIIINTSNKQLMIKQINAANPTLVHIMYDDHIDIVDYLRCSNILYTTHWAYLTNISKLTNSPYNRFIKQLLNNKKKVQINALSDEIRQIYLQYNYPSSLIRVIHNGARVDRFRYIEHPNFGDRSIYIGKIEFRKGQYKYQAIDSLYFVGNLHDSPFNSKRNYLGEWDKPKLYNNLTHYGNLVLLSDGEADPLVVKEALVAGLGVVVSEPASANLDREYNFITVIPNNKLNDIQYVETEIIRNREYSINNRQFIRDYAISKFDWNIIIKRYIECL